MSSERKADRGEIGDSGKTYRRIRLVSAFGNMQINVTDVFLPYPFGAHEVACSLRTKEVMGLDVLNAKTENVPTGV